MFDFQLIAIGIVVAFIVWVTAGEDIHTLFEGLMNLFCPVHRALHRTRAEVLSRVE